MRRLPWGRPSRSASGDTVYPKTNCPWSRRTSLRPDPPRSKVPARSMPPSRVTPARLSSSSAAWLWNSSRPRRSRAISPEPRLSRIAARRCSRSSTSASADLEALPRAPQLLGEIPGEHRDGVERHQVEHQLEGELLPRDRGQREGVERPEQVEVLEVDQAPVGEARRGRYDQRPPAVQQDRPADDGQGVQAGEGGEGPTGEVHQRGGVRDVPRGLRLDPRRGPSSPPERERRGEGEAEGGRRDREEPGERDLGTDPAVQQRREHEQRQQHGRAAGEVALVPTPGARARRGGRAGHPPLTVPASWNTGRYIATTRPPIAPPRNTMSRGSIAAVRAPTASSTSVS